MALKYLQGMENEPMEYLDTYSEIGRRSKAEKKAKRQERKAKRGERKEKRKEKIQKLRKKVGKVGLAPARAAMLTLVKMNVAKVADKLAQAIIQDRERIKKFWEKFGGDFDKLKSAVAKKSGKELGVVTAASVATVVGAATPILVALVKIFKDMKISKEGDKEEDDLIETGKTALANDDSVEKSEMSLPEGNDSALVKGGGGTRQGAFFDGIYSINTWIKAILIFALISPFQTGIYQSITAFMFVFSTVMFALLSIKNLIQKRKFI